MTIMDLAKEIGRSHQAVYKRLKKAGIDREALQEKGTGQLTAEGERIIRELYAVHQEPMATEPPPATPSPTGFNPEVDQLQKQVDSLQQQLTEEKHRAELAELKAEAVADERDFLRRQLDNAIKANALASVKRLTAPDPEEPAEVPAEEDEAVPVEDQPQQPERQRIGARIRAAWQIIRGK